MAEYDPTAPVDLSENDAVLRDQYDDNSQVNGDEDDDYEPATFNIRESSQDDSAQYNTIDADATAISTTEQASKPKTAAGFIIEDESDEENEDAESLPPQPNGTEGAQSGLGSVAVSHASQDVSLGSEPTQDSAAAQTAQDSFNGSTAAASVPAVSDPTDSSIAVSAPATSLPVQQDEVKTAFPPVATGATSQSATPNLNVNGATLPPISNVPSTSVTQRLPHDKVGRLEDRIKDDPKADTSAWFELIQHYRDKHQVDNVRRVYERMLDVFPTAVTLWIQRAQMEIDLLSGSDRSRVDAVFGQSLLRIPHVDLWSMYLDYIRRWYPLVNDPQGQNRSIVLQAFDAVLNAVGVDPDSGKLWREYIDFVKSGPGVIGGSGWQDQQKADQVRQAYHRAIRVPSSELVKLWKEYDNFEMSLSKSTGRKALQDQSPHYMQARTAKTKQDEKVAGLQRKNLPILPPLEGCEGDDAFAEQVEKWRDWIEWEKQDPLVLKEDELHVYRKRVLFVYQQACMQLFFYPPMWFEAAQWCFDEAATDSASEEMTKQGEDFLARGIAANPESVLLALKKADRVEASLEASTSDEVLIANGEKLDVPFETCHKALYSLREKMAEREKKQIQAIREHYSSLTPDEQADVLEKTEDDNPDSTSDDQEKTKEQQMQEEIKATSEACQTRMEVVKRMISHVWIAKMRAFRRIQGQGMPKKPKKGSRGVFDEARPRGQLTSDVYIASALMEWHCYKDAAANKIFDRGMKLFPVDENFALEYIKHLISINDITNARGVYETTINRILNIKDTVMSEARRKEKARPLLGFMHHYESEYGDLAQIQKLEKRMREVFPDEPELVRFSNRFSTPTFDVMHEQIVISPTQAMPKVTFAANPQQALPSIEASKPPSDSRLALGPNGPYVASPKRPLEDDENGTPSRKFIRAESPLKGAAGRRIQSSLQMSTAAGSGTSTLAAATTGGGGGYITKSYIPPGAASHNTIPPQPPRLPQEVNFLLQILPSARDYTAKVFDPRSMVNLIRGIDFTNVRQAAAVAPNLSTGDFYARFIAPLQQQR